MVILEFFCLFIIQEIAAALRASQGQLFEVFYEARLSV